MGEEETISDDKNVSLNRGRKNVGIKSKSQSSEKVESSTQVAEKVDENDSEDLLYSEGNAKMAVVEIKKGRRYLRRVDMDEPTKKRKIEIAAKSSKKRASKKKEETREKVEVVEENINSDTDEDLEGEEEAKSGSGYKISYAVSNRATCRRCDEKIAKETLRVTHRPLFRGKPGFEV